jgi:hypothetical protein
MRLIIEARLADGDNDTVNDGDGVLVVVERPDCSLAQLGLTLAEGRSLLAKVQAELVSKQVEWWQVRFAASRFVSYLQLSPHFRQHANNGRTITSPARSANTATRR